MSEADDIVRLRHMLDAARKALEFARGYFDVDLGVVWRIISTDLPPLVQCLEEAIADNSQAD